MGKKKKNKFVVYSTDPNPSFDAGPDEDPITPSPGDQLLRVQMEKKGRGGKTVTIIRGFEGSQNDLKNLAKAIKTHCGTGGTAKDGEIIIQGDLKQKIIQFLRKKGYKDTK